MKKIMTILLFVAIAIWGGSMTYINYMDKNTTVPAPESKIVSKCTVCGKFYDLANWHATMTSDSVKIHVHNADGKESDHYMFTEPEIHICSTFCLGIALLNNVYVYGENVGRYGLAKAKIRVEANIIQPQGGK